MQARGQCSVLLYVHRNRTNNQGPRTATSTFTQLLDSGERMRCSCSVLLYVHRDRTNNQGPGRPPPLSHSSWTLGRECGVHVQCCVVSTETVRTIRDPGRPPPLSHSSWALGREYGVHVQCCFTSTETVRTVRTVSDVEPRTSTSTFTQLLNSYVTSKKCC